MHPSLRYIAYQMPKVSIPQKNLTIDASNSSNLMSTLLNAGLPVASSCHGEGVCSMCKVKVTSELDASIGFAENLELETLKRNKCEPDERLSCQISITGDLTVTAKYW